MNIGDKMPGFTVLGVDGISYNNFDFADKYAIAIIFTGNKCEYAQAYWSRIAKLKARYEEDNLALLCINSNDTTKSPDDGFEQMVAIAHQANIYPSYYKDENQSIAQAFGATVTPEVFLFNSKREMVYHGAIDDCWDNENQVTRVYLEDAVEYALDGIEVDYPEVKAEGCNIIWK